MNAQIVAIVAAAVVAIGLSNNGNAAVSAEEAQKLKTTLTPFGAERAGNKEGTIPAWTGKEVADAKPVNGRRPDPFANEKPLYSVSAKNLDQYKDVLTDGQKALLRKYPDCRMDVYQTHRTGTAPQWVYDATFKNATTAKLEADNLKVTDAYGGAPFPIPKTGDEVIWNHLLHYAPTYDYIDYNNWSVTSSGNAVLLSSGRAYRKRPYYVEGGAQQFDGYYLKTYQVNNAPAMHAGEATVGYYTLDRTKNVNPAWTYLPGQRRVRKLPVAEYDTPVPSMSGFETFDELEVFLGAPDRYQWKLLGKKEILVPYNENQALQVHDDTQLLGAHFLNPEHVRWELHRVWVVDATLAPGKRHQIPHKRFYIDEDTWVALLADGWDASGQLVKTYWQWLALVPEAQGAVPISFGNYDMSTGGYLASNIVGTKREQYVVPSKELPDTMFTPDNMAAVGQ